MTQIARKLRHGRLFELMRQREYARHVSRRLRVSRQCDGESPAAIMLRDIANRSLRAPRGRSIL